MLGNLAVVRSQMIFLGSWTLISARYFSSIGGSSKSQSTMSDNQSGAFIQSLEAARSCEVMSARLSLLVQCIQHQGLTASWFLWLFCMKGFQLFSTQQIQTSGTTESAWGWQGSISCVMAVINLASSTSDNNFNQGIVWDLSVATLVFGSYKAHLASSWSFIEKIDHSSVSLARNITKATWLEGDDVTIYGTVQVASGGHRYLLL